MEPDVANGAIHRKNAEAGFLDVPGLNEEFAETSAVDEPADDRGEKARGGSRACRVGRQA